MATRDSNLYGKIVVTNRAICSVADSVIAESYGVSKGRVSHILVEDNKIHLALSLTLKFGVTPRAITDSIRAAVKYNVENFTGMRVEMLNINVIGIEE